MLFRRYVIDQSVYVGLIQLLAESGHKRTSVFDPNDDVGTARFSVAHGELFILEQMIEAGAEFSGLLLIFVDVVADRAVFAVQVAAHG